MSGQKLCGIISVASGLTLLSGSCIYHCICRRCDLATCAAWLERRGIDDAVGAVTVHGTIGLFGLIMLGVFASGYPALDTENPPTISRSGKLWSTILLLRFVPTRRIAYFEGIGYAGRTPEAAEIAGLDPVKVPAQANPEGISISTRIKLT